MKHNKKTKEGAAERVILLRQVFPQIETHLVNRPRGVVANDLLDAAVAAWSALRWHRKAIECVCMPEVDGRRLTTAIYY